MTVLVVEDEESVQSVSVEAVRELGFKVLQASDGRQALDIIGGGQRDDLLFTDVVMSGMSGPEFATEVRSENPNVKFLFTTGHASGRELDGEMLPKPFILEQLRKNFRGVE